jgi:endo-1,4-beta-xylanase
MGGQNARFRWATAPAAALVFVAALAGHRSVRAESPSLKDAYKNDFLIGVALGGSLPDDYTAAELALIKSQFNAVTPENCMKPGSIHSEENRWDFAQADALVKFAEANHMQVFGHNLVWHNQTADWFFRKGDRPATRDELLERMKTHIDTVVGRYKGKIRGWDVVNEAIAEGGTDDLRKTSWLKGVGDDYIVQAFRFAHAADPQADLQYNDYNIESNPKRDRAIRLIKNLQNAAVPVAAVGIQGHWILDRVPYADIEIAINEFQKLGVKVMITELDLDVVPRQATGADINQKESDGTNGTTPISEEILKRQAEQYGKLFELFHRHRDTISRVTFWGLNDGRSWLNYWPRQRTDYPLLFDRQSRPKPAFQSVVDVVAKPAN